MTHEEFLQQQKAMLVEAINETNKNNSVEGLRDYFAASALTGLLFNPGTDGYPEDFAGWAYRYADAMLKAREQGSVGGMNWNNNITDAPCNTSILGLFEYITGFREVRVLQRFAKFTLPAESEWGDNEYNEENDTYYCKEGWYEKANDFDECEWRWISTKYLKSWAVIEYPEQENVE